MRRKTFLILSISLWAFLFSTFVSAQQKFPVSATGEQEVPATNSSGRATCMLTLNTAETQITISCTYSNLSSAAIAAHIHNNGPVGVNGPVLFPLGTVSGTSGTIPTQTFAVTPAQVAEIRAKRMYVNIHTTNFPNGEIRGQIKISTTPSDLDGDGRTNIRVFRTSASAFYTLNNLNFNVMGNFFAGGGPLNSTNDDYDGDGRGDLVLLYSLNNALYWRVLQTGTNSVREVQWGIFTGAAATSDQLLPGDYDGDGKADIAVYRRPTGFWYILQSSDNKLQAENFGLPNETGMVGDFDKDGKSDLTVLRGTANGIAWLTRRSSDGKMQAVLWGGGTTAPAGDFIFPSAQVDIDGDGKQDHMVSRDPNASVNAGDPRTFYILRSSDNQPFVLQWGIDTDTFLFGDYDGDGKTDIVARRTVGTQLVWYIFQSSTQSGRAVTFGAAGDF